MFSRPGSRFIALCEPDERLTIRHNRIIIVSPRKPPEFLNQDGSRCPVVLTERIPIDEQLHNKIILCMDDQPTTSDAITIADTQRAKDWLKR